MISPEKLFAHGKFITETELQKISRKRDYLLFHAEVEEMVEGGLLSLAPLALCCPKYKRPGGRRGISVRGRDLVQSKACHGFENRAICGFENLVRLRIKKNN